MNPTIHGQGSLIQAEFIPGSDQTCQNSAFYARMDRLKREIVRCMTSTSERIQHTKETLSTTTELVAYSQEAIARSFQLLKVNKRV